MGRKSGIGAKKIGSGRGLDESQASARDPGYASGYSPSVGWLVGGFSCSFCHGESLWLSRGRDSQLAIPRGPWLPRRWKESRG